MISKKFKFACISILLMISLIFINFCFASDSLYVWSNGANSIKNTSSSNNAVPTSTTPSNDNSLNLESGSAILIEQSSGNVLYAHNIHEQLRPASVTKVMSLLLIMEALNSNQISLDTPIPCSENAHSMGGSQIWLDTKETLTVNDMLKSICVVSANDCTVAMAEYLAGSEEAFVQKMNERAKALGMNDTCFKNCHGIDEEGHYTTAKDIAIMSKELITKHPDIIKYTTIWMDSIRGGTFELANTNKLLKTYNGMTGLKTGSTSQALFNLSATAQRDGLSLIAVVMKAPTSKIRNEEVTTLLNYGFSSYTSEKIGAKGEIIDELRVNKNISNKVKLVLEKDEYIISKKGETKEYIKTIKYNNVLKAPMEKGTVVGNIEYKDKEGNLIYNANLVTEQDVEKSSLWEYIVYITNIFTIKELKTV